MAEKWPKRERLKTVLDEKGIDFFLILVEKKEIYDYVIPFFVLDIVSVRFSGNDTRLETFF